MTVVESQEWSWHRCSILGCGASPFLVRRHPRRQEDWSIASLNGPIWTVPGTEPTCPQCGGWLDALASAGP